MEMDKTKTMMAGDWTVKKEARHHFENCIFVCQ